MPAEPGELSLLTVFADVHYYFSSPQQKPLHHRFDKGSYVYLYRNDSAGHGRLEIANSAGTPDQDAFWGLLESAHITYSQKQPLVCNFTVLPSGLQSSEQWHLPSFDLRNEKKYLYPLHSLDIYFWKADDAKLFLENVHSIPSTNGIHHNDAPALRAANSEDMSPVVQKLEEAAISTPYQHIRTPSSSTVQSFAPPPLTPGAGLPNTQVADGATASYTPAAYNPAAPAAPEPIAYREKTPPPLDADMGTGLAAVSKHEHGALSGPVQYSQYSQQQAQSYFSGPVSAQAFAASSAQHHSSFPPPPPNGGHTPSPGSLIRTSSLPPPPAQPHPTASPSPPHQVNQYLPGPHIYNRAASTSPSSPAYQSQRQSSLSGYSGHPLQQYASYPSPSHTPLASPGAPASASYQPQGPSSPAFAPPPQHPSTQLTSPSPGFAPPASPGYGPQLPVQSPPTRTPHPYAQQSQPLLQNQAYTAQPHSPSAQPSNPYAIHSQVYIPTAAELGAHSATKSGKSPEGSARGQGQGQAAGGKLEQRTDRIEKGVNRFLKKLDKRF